MLKLWKHVQTCFQSTQRHFELFKSRCEFLLSQEDTCHPLGAVGDNPKRGRPSSSPLGAILQVAHPSLVITLTCVEWWHHKWSAGHPLGDMAPSSMRGGSPLLVPLYQVAQTLRRGGALSKRPLSSLSSIKASSHSIVKELENL